jgi:hypothetical protein
MSLSKRNRQGESVEIGVRNFPLRCSAGISGFEKVGIVIDFKLKVVLAK